MNKPNHLHKIEFSFGGRNQWDAELQIDGTVLNYWDRAEITAGVDRWPQLLVSMPLEDITSMLDEVPVRVAGLEYVPSSLLREELLRRDDGNA